MSEDSGNKSEGGGDKKKVFINPNLFNPDNFSRKKKPKPDKVLRIKNNKMISDKTRRNQILRKIRENQEKQYSSLFEGEKTKVDIPKNSNDATSFESDFDKSLSFMSHISDSKPTPVSHNHTFKNTSASNFVADAVIDNELPIDFFLPKQDSNIILAKPTMTFAKPPEYGCLKNGKNPTMRSFHNATMKNTTKDINDVKSTVVGSLQTVEEKQHRLDLMRKLHEQKKDAEKPKPQIVQKKIKKLLRRTFNLGKDRFRPRVGVLLPNKTMRNNVTTKSFMIKQKPISEIRKILLNQGFIKVGSTAPTDVLRKIYESIVLIDGDVKNHNPDNLLYNFFKQNDKL
jgi:hypothetical protein